MDVGWFGGVILLLRVMVLLLGGCYSQQMLPTFFSFKAIQLFWFVISNRGKIRNPNLALIRLVVKKMGQFLTKMQFYLIFYAHFKILNKGGSKTTEKPKNMKDITSNQLFFNILIKNLFAQWG